MSSLPAYLVITGAECTGCHLCEKACAIFHSSEKTEKATLQENELPRIFVIDGNPPIPVICQHCTSAPCERVCPTEAIKRDDKGRVLLDQDKCIACALCIQVCPVGAIQLYGGRAFKCDLCNGDPACVAACPTGTLQFSTPYRLTQGKKSLSEFYSEGQTLTSRAIAKVPSKTADQKSFEATLEFLRQLPQTDDDQIPIVKKRRNLIAELSRQFLGKSKDVTASSPQPFLKKGTSLNDFLTALDEKGLAASISKRIVRRRQELNLPEITEYKNKEISRLLQSLRGELKK